MIAPGSQPADFFISYNGADETWAEWIGDTLEANNYRVILQKWDFRPGNNFVLEMHRAAENAERTIYVLSPNSLASDFAASEWAAAFVEDPRGAKAKLVPVRIAPCEPKGLLESIVYIDLVGLTEDAATAELLKGIGEGRRKPAEKVLFPGPTEGAGDDVSPRLVETDLDWRVLDAVPDVLWHAVNQRGHFGGTGCLLEVHLVPIPERRLEMRRLADLPDELTTAGRAAGFFKNNAAVDSDRNADAAVAESHTGDRQRDVAGLHVTRTGERAGWFTLPADSMGPVFDVDWLHDQVGGLLELLVNLPITPADRYAFALGVTAPMLLTINPVSVLYHRTQSSNLRMNDADIVVAPEDSLSFASLQAAVSLLAVAEELVARLEAAVRS